jgi:hypothetical protein
VNPELDPKTTASVNLDKRSQKWQGHKIQGTVQGISCLMLLQELEVNLKRQDDI